MSSKPLRVRKLEVGLHTVKVVVPVVCGCVLHHASCAERRDVGDVEAVVGADALGLQEVLSAVITNEVIVHVTGLCKVTDGLADIGALRRDIVRIKLEVRSHNGGCDAREDKGDVIEVHDG